MSGILGQCLSDFVRRKRKFHEWRQLYHGNTPAATPQPYFHITFTIPFITDLQSEMKPLFSPMQTRSANCDLNGTNEHYQLLNKDNTVVFIEMSKKSKLGLCVDTNCACMCVSAQGCGRVEMGLVFLRVSCGAPPRPPALDPPLHVTLEPVVQRLLDVERVTQRRVVLPQNMVLPTGVLVSDVSSR